MNVSYFGYNNFYIDSDTQKLLFDPGGDLFLFRYKSLFPKFLWNNVNHIFITHADPDHYRYAFEIAGSSNAIVYANKKMFLENNFSMLDPCGKGFNFKKTSFTTYPVEAGKAIQSNNLTISGIRTRHGNININLGLFSKKIRVSENKRFGWGSIGFLITWDGKTIVNFGDTLFLENDWVNLKNADLIMIPIGGKEFGNTMDVDEAIEVVKLIKPESVIPCHYNIASFFRKYSCKTDVYYFKKEVEKTGSKCIILKPGESVDI